MEGRWLKNSMFAGLSGGDSSNLIGEPGLTIFRGNDGQNVDFLYNFLRFGRGF